LMKFKYNNQFQLSRHQHRLLKERMSIKDSYESRFLAQI